MDIPEIDFNALDSQELSDFMALLRELKDEGFVDRKQKSAGKSF